MVNSKINPEKVIYTDDESLDEHDIGNESSIYELSMFDRKIPITLGKAQFKQGVVFFNIYIVDIDDNEIKSKIGIYEIDEKKSLTIYDEDEDVDISKFKKPILFNFVNAAYINEMLPITDIKEITVIQEETNDEQDEKGLGESIIGLEDDFFSLGKTETKTQSNINIEKKNHPRLYKDYIFENDTESKNIVKLDKETKQIANELKQNFKKSSNNKWIEKFTKNNNYDIIENNGNGDCFFYVIRDAFADIGKITTVEKIRKLLSQEMTEKQFRNYKELYDALDGGCKETENDINKIKKTLRELKKRKDNTTEKQEQIKIIDYANSLKKTENELLKTLKHQKDFINENVGFMRNIKSVEEMKNYINTSNYWADAWSISVLERILNIRMILFSEEAFKNDDNNGVLICQSGEEDDDKHISLNPDYYIMTSYSGDHYRLITYKQKSIFTFHELPYDLTIIILNRCLEKNSGVFSKIEDFKILQKEYNIIDIDEDDDTDFNIETSNEELFDDKIIIQFYAKSDRSKLFGKGVGERVPNDRINDFINLSKDKDWRRMLDDEWICKFKLDYLEWASVEHYYQASKFKKTQPIFYKQFSLNEQSEISKNVDLAKIAGSKSGKMKDKILRPKEILIDIDFYPENNKKYRMSALKAKFEQNVDLKKILTETYPAKLQKFVAKSPPEIDIQLMQLRKEFVTKSK